MIRRRLSFHQNIHIVRPPNVQLKPFYIQMWKCPINEVYYRAIRKLLDSHALPYIARWRHVRTMSRYIRLCLPAKLLRYGPSNRIRLSRPSFRDTRRHQYDRLRSRNNNHYPRSTPKQKFRISGKQSTYKFNFSKKFDPARVWEKIIENLL